jgi:hypothetical protein
MKLRLSILLAAAAMAAAPAAGQTIKSLGYNTTNGNIVAATNVTFTNSVGFSTNARAATRTNLGATTVGNSVFTATNGAAAATAIGLGWVALTNPQSSLYSGTATRLLGYAPEIASGSTNLTGFNVLAYTNTNGLVIPANILIGEDQASGGPRNPRNVTVNGSFTIQYPFSSPSTIYANNSITATDASTYTNTLVTWSSNAATFATNLSVSGSLTATGNATLNGSDNLMPNATTASSASSLMTRGLSDDRYLGEMWNASRMAGYATTNPSVTVFIGEPMVTYTNGQPQGPYMTQFIDPEKYAGKTVKLLAYCRVNSTNGGNVQGVGRIQYLTNTAGGPDSNFPLSPGGASHGTIGVFTNGGTDVFPVATSTNQYLIFTSNVGAIPTNAKMIIASFGFNRASTNTTFTNNLYMQAVQVVVE